MKLPVSRIPRLSLPSLASAASLVLFCSAPAHGAEAFDYQSNLTEVYGAYQGVLARRDACATAYPQARASYEKAYGAWNARHRKLIEELDQRVAMLIRAASKDEKEHARNVGKYEGQILAQRLEAKKELLLQPAGDLEAMCKALPAFLTSADSDLEKAFADELAVVRKRPLARQ